MHTPTRSHRTVRGGRCLALVAVLLALLIAACGDDGGGTAQATDADGPTTGGGGGSQEPVPDGPPASTDDLLAALADGGIDCQQTATVPNEDGTEERCLVDEGWIDVIGFDDEGARDGFIDGGGVLDCSFIVGIGGGGAITVTYIVGPNWIVRPPPDADAEALAAALGGVVRTISCEGSGPAGSGGDAATVAVLDRLACQDTTTEAPPSGAQSANQCLRPGGWAQVYAFADAGARQAFQDRGSGFDCSFVSTLGGGVVARTVAAGDVLVVVSTKREADAVSSILDGGLGRIDCPGVG